MFINPDFLSNTENILLSIFVFIALVQLFYHWFYFARLGFAGKKHTTVTDQLPPVSVVICAKNEYENLKNNLPSILEQDYPNYEVILVNDFSQDESYFLIKSFQDKYPHFKVVQLRENVNFFEGKKLALAVGIKSAKNDHLLLTDADCIPAGKNWIRSMAGRFTPGTEIVLGYGAYKSYKGFLNKLIRFDTLTIAMQYMGMAIAGRPYMGVGRNLAYTKKLFFKTGGFTSHYKIKSGDDDLFVNQAGTKNNTRVCFDPESITHSEPKKTFSSWFKQKKRHLSTGVYYRWHDKIRLGLLSLSSTFFYLTFLLLLLFVNNYEILGVAAGAFLVRTLSLLAVYYYSGKKLSEKKLFIYSPIFDLIFVALNPVFAVSNIFYRKNKWK